MKGVIYARYSSHSKTEQSIEGQLKVCREYAERNDIVIIGGTVSAIASYFTLFLSSFKNPSGTYRSISLLLTLLKTFAILMTDRREPFGTDLFRPRGLMTLSFFIHSL